MILYIYIYVICILINVFLYINKQSILIKISDLFCFILIYDCIGVKKYKLLFIYFSQVGNLPIALLY